MCLQLVLQTHATCREPYQPRHMSCTDCNLVFWNMQSQKLQTLLRWNRSYMKNSHAFSFFKTTSWTLSTTAPSIATTSNDQVASVTTTESNWNQCHGSATCAAQICAGCFTRSLLDNLWLWSWRSRSTDWGVRRTQRRTVSEVSTVRATYNLSGCNVLEGTGGCK
jgi:hypothetical protein